MSEALKKTRKAYEGLATTYDTVNESIEPIIDDVETFLELLEGNLILDVGCGHGRDSLYFSKQGLTTIGLDLSPSLLRIAREKTRDTCFLVADMRYTPFRDTTFDGLWVCASFHHLNKSEAPDAIKAMYRLMKKGGVFYISVKSGDFTGYEESNRYNGEPRFYSYYMSDEITQLLTNTGLTIKKSSEQTQPELNRQWVNIQATK